MPRKHGVSDAGASGQHANEIEKHVSAIPGQPARIDQHEQAHRQSAIEVVKQATKVRR
jgi:hypothetical protein